MFSCTLSLFIYHRGIQDGTFAVFYLFFAKHEGTSGSESIKGGKNAPIAFINKQKLSVFLLSCILSSVVG